MNITFFQTSFRKPTCVYWDPESLTWSEEGWYQQEFVFSYSKMRFLSGCSYNHRKSTWKKTVCECTHLTNFAIIMAGDSEFTDEVAVSVVSDILGILSVSCLMVNGSDESLLASGEKRNVFRFQVSIAILHYLKQTSTMRQIVVINRCYCLLGKANLKESENICSQY